MNDIDFLPGSYHERRLRVRLWLWRFVLLAGFGFVICSVAAIQFAQYRRAEKQLAQMQRFRVSAQEKSESLALLQTQLAEARGLADLYTYLNHPWPSTQLLSAIAKPLPPSMRFSELSISRTSATSGPRGSHAPRQEATDQPGQEQHSARVDLDRLQAVYDRSVSMVRLAGETSDSTALHIYVATLGASPLFTSAELESLESISSGQPGPAATFHIRLAVRHGYGQPKGPTEPPPALASTSRPMVESPLP
ncbi:MAG: hypothetical protein ACC628_20160 [Pirellulaceae bacterium]